MIKEGMCRIEITWPQCRVDQLEAKLKQLNAYRPSQAPNLTKSDYLGDLFDNNNEGDAKYIVRELQELSKDIFQKEERIKKLKKKLADIKGEEESLEKSKALSKAAYEV